jgi:RNA polymerase-binding transcription factor DksA
VSDDFGQRIADERRRLAADIDALERSFTDIVDTTELTTDDEHDPDGSTIAFERAQVVALLRAAREHDSALADAEGRLDAGTFGRCETCGGAIAVERLHALPATRACIRCA